MRQWRIKLWTNTTTTTMNARLQKNGAFAKPFHCLTLAWLWEESALDPERFQEQSMNLSYLAAHHQLTQKCRP